MLKKDIDEDVPKIREECKDPKRVAWYLHEFQMWRRGKGKYEWNEDPNVRNAVLPMTAKELGVVIDIAIKMLKGMGKDKGKVKGKAKK